MIGQSTTTEEDANRVSNEAKANTAILMLQCNEYSYKSSYCFESTTLYVFSQLYQWHQSYDNHPPDAFNPIYLRRKITKPDYFM